jgi:xanthine dehydrogenase molybdenum-binding subunit
MSETEMERKSILEFNLNGEAFSAMIDDDTSLMTVLREQAGLTSPKNGCAPQGSCGCCTVIFDGKAVASCAVPAKSAKDKNVITLEGLTEKERDIFARSFTLTGGIQCGFCIPGIVVRAKHLIDKNPLPSRDEIKKSLNNHICRCTGFVKIVDAIEMASQALNGIPLPEADYSGKIGSSLPKMDGEKLALGQRPYIDDITLPEMQYAAFLFSPHPRIKVIKMDTSDAEQIPGVSRIVTARDVPGRTRQGTIYQDWPAFIAVGQITHCIGDILAGVVASDVLTARKAVEKIILEYEILPAVFDVEEALKPGAVQVHEDHVNVLSKSIIKRGNVKEQLKNSAFVETRTFETQMIEHAFLEPESSIASFQNGVIEVLSQGQGIFDDRKQIASFLNLSEDKITVRLVSNGGAFGGKEDLSIQPHVALMTLLTGKPVKATLTREESIRFHPKRHPIKMTYTVGCDKDGKLTAVHARMIGDKGAYASVGTKVLERAAGHACGPYNILHSDVEALAVYTNNLPGGAMRGFGANQAAFAMEGMMDILAEKVGIDGWEMRWRNVVDLGDTFVTGQVFDKAVGIKKTLLAVKDLYYSSKYVGIACGIKNVGIGNGMKESGQALVTVNPDQTISINTGFTEMGQGFSTVMIQFFCDVTGIDPRIVRVKIDTTEPTPCGMTTASRATVLGGRAVIKAAEEIKKDLDQGRTLKELTGKKYFGEVNIDYTTSLETKTDKPITHMSFSFATQVCILDDNGKLKKFVAAHDVGKVINRNMIEGQLEGSIHMGLGYALTEELRLRDGVPESFKLRSLGILRAKDMPETEILLIEENEPEGPFGAKGVGEVGLVPTAGAVAGALYKFDGIRRYKLPMKDSPAAKAISRN